MLTIFVNENCIKLKREQEERKDKIGCWYYKDNMTACLEKFMHIVHDFRQGKNCWRGNCLMKKNPGRISIFLTALSESLLFCNNSNLHRLVDWKPRVQRSPVSRKMYTQKFRLYILKNLKKRGIESKNNFLVAVGKKKKRSLRHLNLRQTLGFAC